MSSNNPTTLSEDYNTVAKIDWARLLSKEDFENLAGFFDVLIEMDFETKQRNKERGRNESYIKNSPDN